MIHPTPRSTRTDTRVPYATCCRAAFPSSAMLARQVVGALHFDQAAAGTLECRRQPFAAIQVERPGRRAHDQVDVAIVKLIDQMHEASCRVIAAGVELRHRGYQHGMEADRKSTRLNSSH